MRWKREGETFLFLDVFTKFTLPERPFSRTSQVVKKFQKYTCSRQATNFTAIQNLTASQSTTSLSTYNPTFA